MQSYLEFEKPVADIQGKVQELKSLAQSGEAVEIDDEVKRLQTKADEAMHEIYGRLSPWQKTQVARHPLRPHFVDYIKSLITDFVPLAGDRKFAEDAAVQTGFGRFDGKPVAIIGQEKGSNTETRLKHNFGSARPEGYRKAVRVMDMADRFDIPVLFFVDTAGAYPGVGAEERGQAEAIARSTEMCLEIGVPSIAIVIGEGGSGGAIAIATANKVVMLEHSIYTVASPEAAASILWRDAAKAQDAANNMKITAQDLLQFGIIDQIVPEPVGGAHRHAQEVMQSVHKVIEDFLAEFDGKGRLEVREHRREKYLAMGSNLT
ncbi:acetyl-CoA carboxylase carboxyltransferase subunit alpha [Maritalea porphyrae]|jgi:acetyl-CoA carboxylase carboxyl transferase subunit alpha|uniref:acetyl-CoA carboxylase carboxyltransferase subunit alpha n=1 Tax=Maritalea porphyrae TaxID=880732 RepID=UPI0022AE9CEC|nr:acetyl-CoA carboxylase carboxyltransferase subunit alpha [Maritalea porphyrae]MCZ4273904.1 acetyl-CoA carboxylase carboxyltransferase subunit alpha [Maritalea porphyrae]